MRLKLFLLIFCLFIKGVAKEDYTLQRPNLASLQESSLLKININLPYLNKNVKGFEAFNAQVLGFRNKVLKEFLLNPPARKTLDLSFKPLPKSPFFSVWIDSLQTQASSFHQVQIIHLYKGKIITLNELCKKDLSKLVENIKAQMQKRLGKNYQYFDKYPLQKNQSFYIQNSYFILVFDEFKLAPGYMGIIKLIIPKSIMQEVVKPSFAWLFNKP